MSVPGQAPLAEGVGISGSNLRQGSTFQGGLDQGWYTISAVIDTGAGNPNGADDPNATFTVQLTGLNGTVGPLNTYQGSGRWDFNQGLLNNANVVVTVTGGAYVSISVRAGSPRQ